MTALQILGWAIAIIGATLAVIDGSAIALGLLAPKTKASWDDKAQHAVEWIAGRIREARDWLLYDLIGKRRS